MKNGYFAALALLAAAACGGGGQKPAQGGGDETASLSSGGGRGGEAPPPGTPPAPSSKSPDVARGVKAFDAGDVAGAQAAFEAAVKADPKDAVAQFNLGLSYDRQNRPADAEKAYQEALKLRPDFADCAVALSTLYLATEPPRADEAAAVARAALQKHPEAAGLHFNLAVALATKGDKEGAQREFEDGFRKKEDAQARYTYGHLLGTWGQKDRAIEELRLAMKSDDVGIVAAVAHEMLVLREVVLCIAAFDKAIATKDAAELRTERALCKLAAKDEEGALADLRAAIAADAKYALAHYWLGIRMAAQGKLKEAIAEFDAYLKLAPDGAKAKEAAAHKKDLEAKVGPATPAPAKPPKKK